MDQEQPQQWYYKVVYFFIAYQVVLGRLLVVLLILFNIIIWWIGGVKIVNYLITTDNYNKILSELTKDKINWKVYHEQHRPKQLKIISVDKIKVNNNKYDLIAKVHNPNINWLVKKINYAFMVDGYPLDWQNSFILPGRDKYLFHFSYFSHNVPRQIDLKIGQISWQKVKGVNKTNIVDNIIIKDKTFSENKKISQVEFNALNNTPYGFWQIGWQIILYQGQRPIAINYVTSQGFLANENRQISVAWSESLPSPSKIEIIPEIDVFDESNYIIDTTSPVNLIKGAKDIKK
mgnify:CR=1 FL=1